MIMSGALHILPMGVSHRAIYSVYLHSVGLCALTGGYMSVTTSLEAVSERRPSVCFVLTSPLLTISQRPVFFLSFSIFRKSKT